MSKKVTIRKELKHILTNFVEADKKKAGQYIVSMKHQEPDCDRQLLKMVESIESFSIAHDGYVAVLDHGYKIPYSIISCNKGEDISQGFIKTKGGMRQIRIEINCNDDAEKALDATIQKGNGGMKK